MQGVGEALRVHPWSILTSLVWQKELAQEQVWQSVAFEATAFLPLRVAKYKTQVSNFRKNINHGHFPHFEILSEWSIYWCEMAYCGKILLHKILLYHINSV